MSLLCGPHALLIYTQYILSVTIQVPFSDNTMKQTFVFGELKLITLLFKKLLQQ